MSDDPSFGLMFHRTRDRWADYDSIEIRALMRRRGSDSDGHVRDVPDSIASWWLGDKDAKGKPVPYLKDLIVPSSLYVSRVDSTITFNIEHPRFRPVYVEDILAGTAKGMAETLARIERQFTKDDSWSDPGDRLMSMAHAIGAKWICWPRTDSHRIDDTWDRVRWNWQGLTDGRNAYRTMIDRLVREEQAKIIATKLSESVS